MEWIELGKLANIEIGKTPARKNSKYWKGDYTWVSIADMKDKYISDSKEKISKLALKETNIKIVPKGTVIMSFKLSIGKRAITEKDLYTNEAISAFHIKDGNILEANYLYYVLGFIDLMKDTDRAVMGKTLNKSKLSRIKIPVPPMEIQEKIVKVLDQAQALIDKRKEQIEALDLLIESIFYTMFGDPIINSKDINRVVLGDLCTLKAGKFIKAAEISNRDDTENKYPCFGGNGLRGYVKGYTHDGVYPLIGRQGALCGNVHYVDGRFHATEHAIVVKTKVKTNIIWLYYTLKWMNLNRLASGAAQPGLNVGTLLPLKIIHPPLSLQNDFAQKVETIEKQKELLGQSLKLLEENYKSIMEKAFKGQLFN